MADLLSPREIRIRCVRKYLNLPESMTGLQVFAYCAVQMNITEPQESARVDFENDACRAQDIDPPYFVYYFELARASEEALV